MSAKSAERKTNTKFGKSARPPGFLADLTWFGEPDQQNVHPPRWPVPQSQMNTNNNNTTILFLFFVAAVTSQWKPGRVDMIVLVKVKVARC